MNITIAYLYYDLLNLYGESGNVKALKKHLELQGIKVNIKFLTLDDELIFEKYDFVYIGAGTEQNQKIALKHLLTYKNDIKKAIHDNKFFLITGNSIELFGKQIIDINGKKHQALNAFNYTAVEESFRLVDEALFKCSLVNKYILGFQNQSSVIKDNNNHLFEVVNGIGSYPNSIYEGIHFNNFYGTYLIGPFLVRNPEFLKYIVKQLIISKNPNFKFKKFNLSLETKAYENFLDNNYKDILSKK